MIHRRNHNPTHRRVYAVGKCPNLEVFRVVWYMGNGKYKVQGWKRIGKRNSLGRDHYFNGRSGVWKTHWFTLKSKPSRKTLISDNTKLRWHD